ncbi:hypothetical protein ABK040_005355 [Willaertia magna]
MEIISEIVEYIPVQNILNFLLISKDFYQFIEYDKFWKCLLNNYLNSEIKHCKDNLNELTLYNDGLQEVLNVYSIENSENIKYYYGPKSSDDLLSITINTRLLHQLVVFYRNEVKDIMNESENTIFSKRFMHLLQQTIKCKYSTIIFYLPAHETPIELEYLFMELFLLENNNITMIDIDKKFKNKENDVNRKNLQFILNLLKDINIKFSLQNIVYKHFLSKFNLHNISKEFFEYSLITMKDKLFKGPNDYELISKVFEYVVGDDLVIDDVFCKKLNYLVELTVTENCDKQKLIWWLTDNFIYKKLFNLLTCEKDTSKEINNLFKNLQFFKYKDLNLPINNGFFNLHFNFNNFKYLINLNVISNEDLLTLFHKYFVLHNSFRLDKSLIKKQIKLYLNFFINELNFDIYSKDNFGNNIIVNALCHCNFYTIINPIKECCNLQNIDYNKLEINNLPRIIQKQLTTHFENEKLYDIYELQEIKLNSIKEIFKINNDINHSHLFTLSLTVNLYNSKKYIYLLPSLKYLISNINLKDNFEITFEKYVKKEILEKKVNQLEELIILEGNNITRNRTDFNNDLIIYFIYKKIKQLIGQLEQY